MDIPWSITFMTSGSLIGGLISFYIGTKAGANLIRMLVRGKDITRLQNLFDKYGGYALMIVVISPILIQGCSFCGDGNICLRLPGYISSDNLILCGCTIPERILFVKKRSLKFQSILFPLLH